MMFVLRSSLIHALIKYKCPIKKSNQITPTYLNGGQRTLEGGHYLNYGWEMKIHNVYMYFFLCKTSACGIGPIIFESQLLRKVIFL